jgi:hypothetical protein
VAAIAVLIGVQSIGLGLIAQRFAIAHGFLPSAKRFGFLLDAISQERGLAIAAVLVATGLAGASYGRF